MKRLKLIVWGPGAMGQAAIREILRIPEFELVAVFAYSQSKVGQDVGTLIGHEPIGIVIEGNRETIMRMEADCVIHAAAPLPSIELYDEDVLALLKSGKNVISLSSYHYTHMYGEQRVQKLQAACRAGGVTLHGTGIHPSFIFERLGLSATGLSNRVKRVRIREIVELKDVQSPETLKAFGFGQQPDKNLFSDDGMVSKVLGHYYRESINFFCSRVWGKNCDRIEKQSSQTVAENDMHMKALVIKKGEVCVSRVKYTGIIDAVPKVTMEEEWYAVPEVCPVSGMHEPHYWDVEVEGEPVSLRMRLETFASIDERRHDYGADPTMVPYYASVVPALQAVAKVCIAPPGLLYQDVFAHARPNMSSI